MKDERFEEIKNMNGEQLEEAYQKEIFKKKMHGIFVREAIKQTLKQAEKINEMSPTQARAAAIKPIVKVMVLSAEAELGGELTDKEKIQIEAIALRVIGEVMGKE